MKAQLARRIANGINFFIVEGYFAYTQRELAMVTGIPLATLKRYPKEAEIIKVAMLLNNEPLLWEDIPMCICSLESGSLSICNPDPFTYVPMVCPYTPAFTKTYLYMLSHNKYMLHHIVFSVIDGVCKFGKVSFRLSTYTKFSILDKVAISFGYTLTGVDLSVVDIFKYPFRGLLCSMTTLALKDLKLVYSNFTFKRQFDYGEHIFEVYLKASAGKGTISAKDTHMRWLNEQDTLQLKAQLFTAKGHKEKKKSYQTGVSFMQYTPTELMDTVIHKMFNYFDVLVFKENEIVLEPLDFIVQRKTLRSIKLRDSLLLLSLCIGYKDGFVIRPIINDNQQSRVYSVFTSISSASRKALGFTNYDIGSALQTICLHLSQEPDKYPLHQKLQSDKKSFRESVKSETGLSMKDVKTELSKIDNLEKMPKRYEDYPLLKEYFEEAIPLREKKF